MFNGSCTITGIAPLTSVTLRHCFNATFIVEEVKKYVDRMELLFYNNFRLIKKIFYKDYIGYK